VLGYHLLGHVIFLSNGAVAGAMMGCKFGFKKLPEDLLEFPHRKWLDRKVQQFLVTIGLDDQPQVDQQDSQTGKEEKPGEKEVDKSTTDQSETVTRVDNETDVEDKDQNVITNDENPEVWDESRGAKENEEKVITNIDKEKENQDTMDTRSPDQDQPVTDLVNQEDTTEHMDQSTSSSAE